MKLLTGAYNASLAVSRKLDLHGDGATVIADASGPTLKAFDSAVVRVYGIALVNNNIVGSSESKQGFVCQSEDGINTPQLTLIRSVVETQRQPGSVGQCKLKVLRSTLKSPRNTLDHYTFLAATDAIASFDRSNFDGGGSIGSFGGHVTITNSVFDELLGNPSEGALATTAGGSISVSFSTIFNSPMTCGGTDMPACASASIIRSSTRSDRLLTSSQE